MNELHPNPFPAAEELDSVEVRNVPMQHRGVGHRAVLGGIPPVSQWMGEGTTFNGEAQSSGESRAPHYPVFYICV